MRKIRWFLAVLLFLVTVLNYLDRQVFSILAPDLQDAFGWSELDYSRMVNAFQLAYAITMVLSGRFLDRIGARLGLAASVVLWSLAEAAHALARTPVGFGVARFALGIGEAANFPAALKAVTEWFPAEERALATGVVNSGVALGTIVASIGVPLTVAAYGWRATFVVTGRSDCSGTVLVGWLSISSDRRQPRPYPTIRGLVADAPWLQTDMGICAHEIAWRSDLVVLSVLAAEVPRRRVPRARHGRHPVSHDVYVCADVGCLAAGWLSSAAVKRGGA